MSDENDEIDTSQSISPFKRNLGEVPCFRQSLITGICGGIGVGVAYFMATSKARVTSHVAMGSFMCITLGTWGFCRYQWSADRFRHRHVKAALQTKIFYEGTEMEKEILSQSKKA